MKDGIELRSRVQPTLGGQIQRRWRGRAQLLVPLHQAWPGVPMDSGTRLICMEAPETDCITEGVPRAHNEEE